MALHLEHLVSAVNHPPFTLVHGDYRLDNLFFSDDGEVVVIDWQLPFRGFSGAFDFALLVASSLMPEDRDRLMPTLEALYLEELARAGVAEFGIDDSALRSPQQLVNSSPDAQSHTRSHHQTSGLQR